MPFDSLLGAGRSPQVRNSTNTYRIKQDNVGLGSASNFPGTTESLSINSGEKAFLVQVRIFPASSGSSIDSARLRIRINQYVIADYKLPNNDSWASDIDESVPCDILIDGNYSLIVEYGPELADATGYNIGFSVTLFTITY